MNQQAAATTATSKPKTSILDSKSFLLAFSFEGLTEAAAEYETALARKDGPSERRA